MEKKLRKRELKLRALTLMRWSLGSLFRLDDLKGLFQPKLFHDHMKISHRKRWMSPHIWGGSIIMHLPMLLISKTKNLLIYFCIFCLPYFFKSFVVCLESKQHWAVL